MQTIVLKARRFAHVLRTVAGTVLLLAFLPSQAAPTVSVGPGSNFGYIPLAVFGAGAMGGFTDDSIQDVALSSFVYGGQSWSSVGISSNGYLAVGGGGASANTPVNQNFPFSGAPNAVLAPFWTDLAIETSGEIRRAVLTDGVQDWWVVEWTGMANKVGPGTSTFQVWIGLNGYEDIWFEYESVAGAGSNGQLTVGAEDATGTVGDAYYYNGAGVLPVAGQTLRVSTADLPVQVIPEPASALLFATGIVGLVFVRRRKPT